MRKVKTPEPELFQEFWALWRPHMRHTDGRGDARERYRKKLLEGADPQDIIDGAKGFIHFMPEKDKAYIPLAASWLNKEAYADWCDRWRAYQARISERESNVVSMGVRAAPLPERHFSKVWAERKAAE